ncbi:MAG TPA: hypothetical protein VG937_05595 [Polyangiaceae bacterium]|nr:hypothetical protein [Polyangiaceae bacterium]
MSDRDSIFSSRPLLWPALCVLAFASVASAQTTPPAPSAQPAVPAGEAAPPAAPAASEPTPAPSAGSDTRGEALRAYQAALEARKLAATVPLSTPRLQSELSAVEDKILAGRRDEAIADLVYLVESPRFDPFAKSGEGRAALFLLGDSLGRAGAYEPARAYLVRLLSGSPNDTWFRRATDSLVDLALECDRPGPILQDLTKIESSAPPEVQGDISYLRGRVAELGGKPDEALAAYARVGERSRFWAQATYLSGVIEVERKNLKRGEELFCRVADPKRTPNKAALFGGSDFFRVRDLSRLGLGRVAHEQFRFDDARYYYYLVPSDSERLPEALYETATTRYEAKDYQGARESIDDLRRLKLEHPYQDEAWILDAYIDLAMCRFPQADQKLTEFLKRYEPARDAARKVAADPGAMKRLVDAVRRGTDPAGAGLGVPEETARALGAQLRLDAGYGRTGRRIAQVEHQLAGLRGTLGELDEAKRKLSAGTSETKPQSDSPLGQRPLDKVARIEAQMAELKRVLREAERAGAAQKTELEALRKELEGLELRAGSLRASLAASGELNAAPGADLDALITQDRKRATEMHQAAEKLREELEAQQIARAKDAFQRLDLRLSRLVNRARLGRIETVLGKKRALEIEVQALSQGLLPQTIVDSLRAERYLGSNEEYWPFEGEDWADEYVGGEGLR